MEVVITGWGVVSPYGVGRDVFWQNAVAGRCAIRPIARFDASAYRTGLGGEVPDFDPGDLPRATALAVAAAREAVEEAGLERAEAGAGLVLGTNFGNIGEAETAFRAGAEGKVADAGLTRYLPAAALGATRAALGLGPGPEAVLSLSCASGAAALGTALEWIRAGRAEVVLAGGFDELSESTLAGLSALRAVTKDAVRPFDAKRSGTLFSEGAAVAVVETAERAAARGARPYARLRGRGIDNDAFHMTAPDKSGAGIRRVMRMALGDAGLPPAAVEHVNCHGTATKYNDAIETEAIREVLGPHAANVSLTANKSLIGHTMGAAGAVEAACACLTLRHGIVPPTIGIEERDPALDLDVVVGAPRRGPVGVALANSYGLGGTNACLVLEAAERAAPAGGTA